MIDEKMILEQIADFKRSQKSTNCDYLTGYISALSAVEGMIAEQPKVGEWIPCSERLPEAYELVLIQNIHGVMVVSSRVGEKWFNFQGIELWEAIAWMPLPEPYKGVD